MMRIIDISMNIDNHMPVYKGRPSKRPKITVDRDFKTGSVYETALNMNVHTGTHMDAPLHMLPEGSTIDRIDLNKVVASCKVFDLTQVRQKITKEHLLGKDISEGDFILLKTRNSFEDILEGEFIYLDGSGAEYLKSKNISGVGIDALGIERDQLDHETHRMLLGEGIIILEGLRLKEAGEGAYQLLAVPLKITGAEASPVRALLIEK